MQFDFSSPTPLAYFATLVQRDDGLPLLEAAASLGQDDHPALDVQQVLHDVGQLAARLQRRVKPDADAMERLRALNQSKRRAAQSKNALISSVAPSTSAPNTAQPPCGR